MANKRSGGDRSRDQETGYCKFPAEARPAMPRLIPPAHKRIATQIRFDAVLLKKIDTAAKRRGLSRSVWIHYTLNASLEDSD